MIIKTKHGYQVKSERGVPLSSDDLTEDEARERLRQVEYFKHKNDKKKKRS